MGSTVKDRALVPPKPEEVEHVMKLRGKIPEGEWFQKLERVLAKQLPDETPKELDTEEVLRIAPESLVAAFINRMLTVKEFIDGIIAEKV